MRRWFLICLLLLATQGYAVPKREAALQPQRSGATDLASLRRQAEGGNGDAMAQLGWEYRQGRLLPRNLQEGRRWLEAGVERGSTAAIAMLGWALLEDGGEEPETLQRGRELLQAGAEGGDPWAQMAWGYCIAAGDCGLTAKPQEALPWLQAAAEGGVPYANWLMAKTLAELVTQREDREAAEQELSHWYRAAAEAGIKTAAASYGYRLETGLGQAIDLKQAARWYRLGAEQGDAYAQFKLAYFLDNGLGVARDSAAARIWNEQAAAKGDADAKLNLGVQHEMGRGGPVDLDAARRWYEAAAGQGNAMAMSNLANLLLRPHEPSGSDCRDARNWLEKATQAGYAKAYAGLGYYYESGRCQMAQAGKARALYLQGAERGSSDAMWYLARQLRGGRDNKAEDPAQARSWLERCRLKDIDCAEMLARMQANGEGAAPDLAAAERTLGPWLEKNHAVAQSLLGELLDHAGEPARALPWLQLAARQNMAEAQARLGWLTLNGLGGAERNVPAANALISQALKAGNTLANGIAMRRSCAGLTEAKLTQSCLQVLRLLASLGSEAEAQVRLGKAYQLGLAGSGKAEEAFRLFRSSAISGNAEGQTRLALAFYEGYGTEPDATKAASWARKAAEQGNAEAQSVLGYLYEHGEGLARDLGQALHWYRKAAEQGYGLAFNNLAHLHERGLGLPQDLGEARRLYERAWQAGEPAALNKLALMLEQGQGGPADPTAALKLLRLSAARGDRWACQHLGRWLSEGRHGVQDLEEGRRLLALAQGKTAP